MAGGNSIFNVIVDTDDTAAKLMDLLERKKLGRVTFMPLNTLAKRMSSRKELKEKVVAYLIEVRLPAASGRCALCVTAAARWPVLSRRSTDWLCRVGRS